MSTWLLGLFKRLALRHRVLCQGLAVSTGSHLLGKCVITAIVDICGRQGKEGREGDEKTRQKEAIWMEME